MTNKISIDNRELLQKISIGEAAAGIDFGNAIVRELAAFRLSAMGDELHTDDELSNLLWYSQEATCHSDPNYYCEFQRLATPGFIAWIIRELQERRKAAMDSDPVATLDVQSRRPDGNKFALVFSSAAHKLPDDVYYLYRHAQPAPVVPDDVQRDAKRWRALLGSARIRILGSAGFDATAYPGENPDYRHFGMEIWTHYPNWLHEKNEYGIDTLTQYADAMLAAAPQEVKGEHRIRDEMDMGARITSHRFKV